MNEIQPIDDFEKMLAGIESIDVGVEMLDKLDIIEQMLKKADVWHEKAQQFIALEARALIKVAEVFLLTYPDWDPDDEDCIPQFGNLKTNTVKYRVLSWLIEITPEERSQAYNMAVDSCQSLMQVWRDYVDKPYREQQALEDLDHYRETVLGKFKGWGEVSLADYDYILATASRHLSPSVVKGFKDEVRDDIRKMGGHGLGDGNGTYMNAETYKDSVAEIVENKIDSIRLDMHRLKEVMDDGGGQPEFSIRRKHNFTDDLTVESCIGIGMMLCDIGEVDWGQCSEFSRLKMVAKVVEKLGYTPYDFILKLASCCSAYGVPLSRYGFPEDEEE